MSFRIGRKYASHSYPQNPLVAGVGPRSVDRFSAKDIPSPADPGIAFIANGGDAPLATPFEYPAVESTSQAKYVARVTRNTLSTAMAVSLTRNGGGTLLGTLTFAPGETGNKVIGPFPFALVGSETNPFATTFYDVAVNVTAGGIGTADLSVSVELIP